MIGVEVTDIRTLNELGFYFWEKEDTLIVVQNDLIVCQFKLNIFGDVVLHAPYHFCISKSFIIKEVFGSIFISGFPESPIA